MYPPTRNDPVYDILKNFTLRNVNPKPIASMEKNIAREIMYKII